MPAAGGCSNCCCKYSLLNRETSCSNCPLSFCKKCVSNKAHISRLGVKQVPVCYNCYQKLEAAKIKPAPSTSANGNWWGEGLPPPSMRQQIGQSGPSRIPPRVVATKVREEAEKSAAREKESSKKGLDETRLLEKRLATLTQKDDTSEPAKVATVEQLEERLAALRDCDVELVRNPRLWFHQSKPEVPTGNSVDGLMEQAKSQATLDEEYDPDKLLLNRAKRLRDGTDAPVGNEESPSDQQPEESEFGTATEQELSEIKRLMSDAEQTVNSMDADDKKTEKEMREVLASTRQKSLDIQKVTDEVTNFWNRQMDKTVSLEDDDSDKSVDDETLRQIMKEAENAPDLPPHDKPEEAQSPSPKKGLFGKLFKR